MGADYYEENSPKTKEVSLGIGTNSKIVGAIIDKNARIGKNVLIEPFPLGTEEDHQD